MPRRPTPPPDPRPLVDVLGTCERCGGVEDVTVDPARGVLCRTCRGPEPPV